MRGLNGSASLAGKRLILTVTNPDLNSERDAEIAIRGAKAGSVKATLIAADDVHAHNSFEEPSRVVPRDGPTPSMSAPNSTFVYKFSPASVTKLEIDLV
jgi:alpha-N-arabinofuranosidase